jgi:hypothetical protein
MRWRVRDGGSTKSIAISPTRLARPLAALTEAVAERERERREHLVYKPGLIESLLSRKRLRQWQGEDGALADAVAQARQSLRAAQAAADDLAAAAAVAQAQVKNHQERLAWLERQISSTEAAISQTRRELKDALPGTDWWDDDEKRELAAPWTDAVWNAARTRLFLAALDLHRAFLVAEADRMRQNLSGAIDILQGDVPRDAPPRPSMPHGRACFSSCRWSPPPSLRSTASFPTSAASRWAGCSSTRLARPLPNSPSARSGEPGGR